MILFACVCDCCDKDVFWFRANLLDMSVALKLLDYLSKETDYVAWQAFAREMKYVELMLDLTPLFGDLEVRRA